MVALVECIDELNQYLEINRFQDYGPNGLQVQGGSNINHVVTGVSACQALFKAAYAQGADLIVVHHGLFWNKQSPCLTGVMYERVRYLIEANMSLAAYHLPLDAHAISGNNVLLAQQLGASIRGPFDEYVPSIGYIAAFKTPVSVDEFSARIHQLLGRVPDHFEGTGTHIQQFGICSGAAQQGLYRAIELGLDAYLTGEVSEYVPHLAQESGVHYFGAGHHATERLGVQALGDRLSQQFKIDHTFLEISNSI
ncbi:MAG: Nif3-like dinuclear metal center hexameric protein [Legionellales bacterium]|nr:Nif3-like dinuclear metal center hexameric protein [Legionellales bacterium]|tara:strand:- start:802 stop:1557 length:756 start_codon:yes stop_codon:yes gene_type:complete